MDLAEYRESEAEIGRTEDLMHFITAMPNFGGSALDIGARDGHFSRLLANHFQEVHALDLEKPSLEHERITCIKGDVTDLDYPDNRFDLVFCAEVLEHIPPRLLDRACSELSRVCRNHLIIGVPYKQDIRLGRTTCYSCGLKNPPWGHVNRFDLKRLRTLFPDLEVMDVSFIGKTRDCTNPLSTLLMDLAGNPYGTYTQDEPCIHCGMKLTPPPERSLLQKVFTRSAFLTQQLQKSLTAPHANWIHVLFSKPSP